MAGRKRSRRVLLAAIALLPLICLPARAEDPARAPGAGEAEPWGYAVSFDGEGNPTFEQTLRWDGNPYVLRYEVEVCEASSGERVLIESTDAPEIVFSLPPGSYRYRILFYNLLDRLEVTSPWVPFLILKAEQPVIADIAPGAVYLEEPVATIMIVGTDIGMDARVYLRKGASAEFQVPGTPDESGTSMMLQLPLERIDVGDYTLTVINPGGLTAEREGGLSVRYLKPVDFFIYLGYSPWILLYDDWYTEAWPVTFQPVGFGLRTGFFFLKRRAFYLGTEAGIEYHEQQGGIDGAVIDSRYAVLEMNLLGKFLFSRRLGLVLRTGGGVMLSYHSFDYDGTPGIDMSSSDPALFSALTLQFHVSKRFFIEGGAAWNHIFHSDFNAGHIQPVLTAGFYR